MKHSLFFVLTCLICLQPLFSQEPSTEFDKKFRFGLRVTPQVCWYTSGDKNNVSAGTSMGFGFGLNMERRLSPTVTFLTGIGGDFEGGKYTVRNDAANNYVVKYWMDQSNEFVVPKAGKISDPNATVYVLKERLIKTTHITIPLLMKLSTQEYSGLKYFGMFGAEVGFRVRSTADDSYSEVRKYTSDTDFKITSTDSKQTDLNLSSESSSFPMRFGLNAGLGFEYRMAGSTSFLFSINYFRSFTNVMQNESDVAYYGVTSDNKYLFVKQNLKQTAIRLTIGIMF
ncbi:MAG: outer membrane beta-barrel protein [bacterium]|nr:outer membrane beta-barrel protein [bacterium]